MAFFKFRLPGQAAAELQGNSGNNPADSVDAMRRRARHRLIGAVVLVVLGVIGFPLLFDTQPRPVSADISVDIPDRAAAKPLASVPMSKPLLPSAGLDAKEEVVLDTQSHAQSASQPEPKVEAKEAKPKADMKPEVAAATTSTTAVVTKVEPKTDAKSEIKPTPDSKDTGARFVVQAGAFSDEGKLREVRNKLEKAGIATYTQVIDGKEGRRVRVRIGPFSSRDEADKVARKIKQLSLQPQVLTL